MWAVYVKKCGKTRPRLPRLFMREREAASLCTDQKQLASCICCPASTWLCFLSRGLNLEPCNCRDAPAEESPIKSSHPVRKQLRSDGRLEVVLALFGLFVCCCVFCRFYYRDLETAADGTNLRHFSLSSRNLLSLFHHSCLLLRNCQLNTTSSLFFSFCFVKLKQSSVFE